MLIKKIVFLSFALVLGSAQLISCTKKSAQSSNGDNIKVKPLANLKKIYFDFDQYSIRNSEISSLKENASWLKNNSDENIIIEGHCDERGTNEYNMALGERRAKAAKDYLVNLGLNPAKIETVSYGEEKPADVGHEESAWSKNRRAEFVQKQ